MKIKTRQLQTDLLNPGISKTERGSSVYENALLSFPVNKSKYSTEAGSFSVKFIFV